MDNRMQTVLEEYERRATEESRVIDALADGEMAHRRDEFLISVGPRTGTLLNILAKESGARTILEIGASYGYSTVWLADAARETGGRVTSLELSETKVAYARERLARAGLLDYVDFRLGDARESLAALAGPFEFVLLDLWKDLYIPCFDAMYPKLARGAFVAADNMLQPA
ncbi:MAG TPA: class I SAM-dependent methyltransferase, partial [Vicinamibacterales bacterium]|nr:class I SAM-dependent methyltransferase [Vicinamibacterales bacterium]